MSSLSIRTLILNILVLTVICCTWTALYSQEVTINEQQWTSQNLNVSQFQNGDPIPHAKTPEEWINAGFNGNPAWCYYNNDPANEAKYGRLYNFYAVNDKRGLAPKGWHVATDKEWADAVQSLGGDAVALPKLCYNSGWTHKGNNSSGFSAKPGGWCSFKKNFYELNSAAVWWTSSQCGANIQAVTYKISNSNARVTSALESKSYGYYVRCVKGELKGHEDICKSALIITNDNPLPQSNNNPPVLESLIFTESTVKIGGVNWALENLDVTTFRNGDAIMQAQTESEWAKAAIEKKPSWCYVYFNNENGLQKGIIYNWYAVNDSRGLAPTGWVLPTATKWEAAVKALGGDSLAALKIKALTGWKIKGTNETKFSAMPTGYLSRFGKLNLQNYETGWWTSSSDETATSNATAFKMSNRSISRSEINKGYGFLVRCIKQ